jgi:sulfur carrier protein
MIPVSDESIQILVNGEPRALRAGTTVAELVAALAPAGRKLAVERNGGIVPKSLHAATPLANGDRLEVVIAVGGG